MHSPIAACPPLRRQLKTAVQRRRESVPRILFDLRWLNPGKVGGVEQMAHELIAELAAVDRNFAYRFLFSSQQRFLPPFPRGFSHRVVAIDARNKIAARKHGLIESLTASLNLPPLTSPELRALELYTQLDFTVVHGLPSFVHPDLRRFPSVVTIHDLQHLHYPEFFSPVDIATREREYRESCELASHVICISEFTRQDVHRRYGVPLEKMTVVWNLPPRINPKPLGKTVVRRLLAPIGVQPPFVLYPAQPWRHKNHCGLLEAVRMADKDLPPALRIVLTGQPFPRDHPATAAMLEPTVQRRVQHVGYRTPVELAALYQTTEALIFPSLFEGFGMPVIEAMQRGCPVICGKHSALPEIAGEAAYFTDVASPSALAAALVTITRDTKLRAVLQERGMLNLRRFNRHQLAEKTRSIYAKVHAEHFDSAAS